MPSDAGVKLFRPGDPHDRAIVFAGEPSLMEADVWLQNDESADLLLREAFLVSSALPMRLHRDRVARLPLPKVLPAGQGKLLSISFDLDPSTAPGAYDAEIWVEGDREVKRFPAQIIVLQNYALSLEPDQIVLSLARGGASSGELIVHNEGNVPIHVMPIGEFPLKDPLWFECGCECCCRERDAVERDGGRHGESTEERVSDEDDEDLGTVVIENEDVSVPPGRWALVRFIVKSPEPLPANAHLRARPRIGTERFDLDILTPFEAEGGVPRHETHRKRKHKKGA